MTAFVLRRAAASALLLMVVLTTTFLFIHLAPGDPFRFYADPRVPAEQNERLRQLHGLDRPLIVQYGAWLRAIAVEGDWGLSFSSQRPAAQVVTRALPNHPAAGARHRGGALRRRHRHRHVRG
ncbi:MAG: ABC transporter permease, partial [Thermoanaerobaculia bacterium]|nr:ABC transporter permease [Thermoanaerobaculia bacterium]